MRAAFLDAPAMCFGITDRSFNFGFRVWPSTHGGASCMMELIGSTVVVK